MHVLFSSKLHQLFSTLFRHRVFQDPSLSPPHTPRGKFLRLLVRTLVCRGFHRVAPIPLLLRTRVFYQPTLVVYLFFSDYVYSCKRVCMFDMRGSSVVVFPGGSTAVLFGRGRGNHHHCTAPESGQSGDPSAKRIWRMLNSTT